MRTSTRHRETCCEICLNGLEESTENLVDVRVPASRDTPATSSHESDPEPWRKVVSGKHSIHTHFPKDQNCEIRKRTKIMFFWVTLWVFVENSRIHYDFFKCCEWMLVAPQALIAQPAHFARESTDLTECFWRGHGLSIHVRRARLNLVWRPYLNVSLSLSLSLTKITRAPCRRRTGEAIPRAGSFGDLITADHKVLSEGSESRNNHRYAAVVQDLAKLNGFNVSAQHTKKNHRKRKGVHKSSSSRQKSQKSFTLTLPWNLAKPVKNYPGIRGFLGHFCSWESFDVVWLSAGVSSVFGLRAFWAFCSTEGMGSLSRMSCEPSSRWRQLGCWMEPLTLVLAWL